MKMLNKLKNLSWVLLALAVFSLASCQKTSPNLVGGTGAPTIASLHTVYKTVVDSTATTSTTTYSSTGVPTTTTSPNYNPKVVPFDSLTTSGKGGNLYRIVGTNLGSVTSITFNGVAAYFNRALASDNSVIVQVPTNAPFGATQAGTLVLTTLHGSVTYKFTVIQPAPTITSFSPVAGSTGDTVTINGAVLDAATSVKFGTKSATIVSNTSTQIKVLLPAGVVQAFITVTTAGGSSTSATSFGYKYIIFDDALTKGWGGNGGGYSGYNSTLNFANTTNVERGTNSISVVFANNYGALQIGYGGSTPVSVATLGLKSIKFFIYGGASIKAGDRIQVVINGNYSNAALVTMTPGAYGSFTVPLSSLGNPTTITEVVFQAYGLAVPSTIYVDDIGFI
ncbi:MAG: IPT/TIG domain-containing protein [Mucilaginibacter sp.]